MTHHVAVAVALLPVGFARVMLKPCTAVSHKAVSCGYCNLLTNKYPWAGWATVAVKNLSREHFLVYGPINQKVFSWFKVLQLGLDGITSPQLSLSATVSLYVFKLLLKLFTLKGCWPYLCWYAALDPRAWPSWSFQSGGLNQKVTKHFLSGPRNSGTTCLRGWEFAEWVPSWNSLLKPIFVDLLLFDVIPDFNGLFTLFINLLFLYLSFFPLGCCGWPN